MTYSDCDPDRPNTPEVPTVQNTGSILQKQMEALGTTSYWEAVALKARRQEHGSLCKQLLGFDLM